MGADLNELIVITIKPLSRNVGGGAYPALVAEGDGSASKRL